MAGKMITSGVHYIGVSHYDRRFFDALCVTPPSGVRRVERWKEPNRGRCTGALFDRFLVKNLTAPVFACKLHSRACATAVLLTTAPHGSHVGTMPR